MEAVIKDRMLVHLKRMFALYGIEGSEQKICEIYKYLPIIKQKYLALYWNILRA
jgi:hypothetical protein